MDVPTGTAGGSWPGWHADFLDALAQSLDVCITRSNSGHGCLGQLFQQAGIGCVVHPLLAPCHRGQQSSIPSQLAAYPVHSAIGKAAFTLAGRWMHQLRALAALPAACLPIQQARTRMAAWAYPPDTIATEVLRGFVQLHIGHVHFLARRSEFDGRLFFAVLESQDSSCPVFPLVAM